MALVSIVIPAYNAAMFLNAALDSVLKQTFRDWEVLLVDDGSTDTTATLVQQRLPEFGGRLHYIYQANRGLPAARNTAIANASGDYLALLDADDIWLPHRLERSVQLLEEHPEAGLIHGRVCRVDAAGHIIGEPARPQKRYLSGKIASHIYTRRAHILCPTVTFRAACIRDVGVFDETLRATEDRDLWFRIASHFAVAYVDEVIAYYRVSPGAMSRDLDRMFAAQLQFIRKHRHAKSSGWVAYRQALSGMYRERGDATFNNGQLWKAITCYASSVRSYPPAIRNSYMFLRALSEPAVQLLRLSRRPGTA